MSEMNGTQFAFNPAAEGVKADTGFDTLPAGWYAAMITGTEIVPNKNADGTFLKVKFTLQHPDFAKGRVIFNNYNITNPKEQAVTIGKAQLTGMMECAGVPYIQQTTAELHGKYVAVKLKIKPAEGTYSEQNEIMAYKAPNEAIQWATKPTPAPGVTGAPAMPNGVAAPPTAAVPAPPVAATVAAPPAVAAPPVPAAAVAAPVATAAPVAAADAPAQPWAQPATAAPAATAPAEAAAGTDAPAAAADDPPPWLKGAAA